MEKARHWRTFSMLKTKMRNAESGQAE